MANYTPKKLSEVPEIDELNDDIALAVQVDGLWRRTTLGKILANKTASNKEENISHAWDFLAGAQMGVTSVGQNVTLPAVGQVPTAFSYSVTNPDESITALNAVGMPFFSNANDLLDIANAKIISGLVAGKGFREMLVANYNENLEALQLIQTYYMIDETGKESGNIVLGVDLPQSDKSARLAVSLDDSTGEYKFELDGVDTCILPYDNTVGGLSATDQASAINELTPASLTVSTLAAGTFKGQMAIATDGLRAGETTGNGTGCPVWWDGTNWLTYYDNSIVQA